MSDHHGSTPAAWTAVLFVIAGFLVGAVGLVAARPLAIYAGAAVVVLGGIIGKVMQVMGLGQRAASMPATEESGD